MHGNLVSSSALSVVGDESSFLIYGKLKWDESEVYSELSLIRFSFGNKSSEKSLMYF
jgi:hypothetical protein